MLNWLLDKDVALFRLLNSTLTNPLFDVVMPFVTNPRNWIAPIALLAFIMLRRDAKRACVVMAMVIVSVAATDLICYQVFKPAFHRLRPSHALQDARVLGKKGGKYGFPSNHAANSAAAVTIAAYYYRRRRVLLGGAFAAGLIAYSRVYVGVHYPLDVTAGAMIGASISLFWIFAWQQAERRRLPQCARKFVEKTPAGQRLIRWMQAARNWRNRLCRNGVNKKT